MALSKISNGSIDSTVTNNVAGLDLIAVNEKTASDFSSGTNFMDIANCFTSEYEDYYVRYYCQSTDATVNSLNFALETSGASVTGATEQFSSPTFSSNTFNAIVYYEKLSTASQGYVNSFAEGFCFLGANTSDATAYFEGELWLRNVYSNARFSYWHRHQMQHPTPYYEYGGGAAVTFGSAIAARGIRFFTTDNANFGSGTGALNTYGRTAAYGVKKG
tara:strand:- start:1242 stop:1895 length:654 start_codon:yes stop_codon:yes gene_type:complete